MSLSPDWIVGFTDGEGCFKFNIQEQRNSHMGFFISPCFEIQLHEGDVAVLKKVLESLKIGIIERHNRKSLRARGIKASDMAVYYVNGLPKCLILRDFFNKHPLVSKKKEDFAIWSTCLDMMKRDQHRKVHGFLEIVKLRDQMNLAGKQRSITCKRYRNYEWFREKLLGKNHLTLEVPTES